METVEMAAGERHVGEIERNWADKIAYLGTPAEIWDAKMRSSFIVREGQPVPETMQIIISEIEKAKAEGRTIKRPEGVSDEAWFDELCNRAYAMTPGFDAAADDGIDWELYNKENPTEACL